MKTWSTPAPAALPVQPDRLRVFDTASQSLRHPGNDAERASLYVCGITPYDATHLGHATTYVAFDLLQRYWRAAGTPRRSPSPRKRSFRFPTTSPTTRRPRS